MSQQHLQLDDLSQQGFESNSVGGQNARQHLGNSNYSSSHNVVNNNNNNYYYSASPHGSNRIRQREDAGEDQGRRPVLDRQHSEGRHPSSSRSFVHSRRFRRWAIPIIIVLVILVAALPPSLILTNRATGSSENE